MRKDVRAYFEETVIPLIADRFPDVASEMSIKVGGSFGLGIADEHSDLDADIYLDDELWKTRGGQLQLALLHDAHDMFRKLRVATGPERSPDRLWRTLEERTC